MPNQRWRPVPGWPGYEAGARGHIRSVERELSDGRTAGGVTLTPVAGADGYLCVTLSDGPRRRQVHVARLVLEAFDGPCPEGMEACHRNGKRADVRYANLYWGTKAENRADRERHRREREAASRTEVREAGETGATARCHLEVSSGGAGNGRSQP